MAGVQWQVKYTLRGVDYWWDYPAGICQMLEDALLTNELVQWTWFWDHDGTGDVDEKPSGYSQPRMSHYVLDPIDKRQRNLSNGYTREMRRAWID